VRGFLKHYANIQNFHAKTPLTKQSTKKSLLVFPRFFYFIAFWGVSQRRDFKSAERILQKKRQKSPNRFFLDFCNHIFGRFSARAGQKHRKKTCFALSLFRPRIYLPIYTMGITRPLGRQFLKRIGDWRLLAPCSLELQLKNPLGEQELRHRSRSHFGQGESGRLCVFFWARGCGAAAPAAETAQMADGDVGTQTRESGLALGSLSVAPVSSRPLELEPWAHGIWHIDIDIVLLSNLGVRSC
jgi:hypothetical protein